MRALISKILTGSLISGAALQTDNRVQLSTPEDTPKPPLPRQLAYDFCSKFFQSEKQGIAKELGIEYPVNVPTLEADKAILRSVHDAGKVDKLTKLVQDRLDRRNHD